MKRRALQLMVACAVAMSGGAACTGRSPEDTAADAGPSAQERETQLVRSVSQSPCAPDAQGVCEDPAGQTGCCQLVAWRFLLADRCVERPGIAGTVQCAQDAMALPGQHPVCGDPDNTDANNYVELDAFGNVVVQWTASAPLPAAYVQAHQLRHTAVTGDFHDFTPCPGQ